LGRSPLDRSVDASGHRRQAAVQGITGRPLPRPRWGYVLKGQIRIIYADREEVLRNGDLYYLPSGHTAVVEEDFESVEFSSPGAHEQVLDVIRRNAALAQTAFD
jgi:hypothetical protein